MKKVIRLSESELISIVKKVIYEQQDLGLKGKTLAPKYGPQKPLSPEEYFKKYGVTPSESVHKINIILGIGSMFFGVPGRVFGALVGLNDAKLYYDEGETKTAGMVAFFSALPLLNSIKYIAPSVAQLGKKGMEALAPKFLSGGASLSNVESAAVREISENLPLIQKELNTHVMNLATQALKTSTNPTAAQLLKNVAQKGIKGITKAVAPFVAAGGAYSQGYDEINKNDIRTKVESEGMEWEAVKTSFESSGSQQDNILLGKAWSQGWRPGILVPKEFRTQKYQNELDKIK